MQLTNIRVAKQVVGSDALSSILGESVWHSLTNDPTIVDVSRRHFDQIATILRSHWGATQGTRLLEVASYAHTSGYSLVRDLGMEVTLLDVSANSLRLGQSIAVAHEIDTGVLRRIAGDFHNLPFPSDSFDVVYICSALHHTVRWEQLVDEMTRVLAPGGLLILDNEPCQREFCFYRFRTNRPRLDDVTLCHFDIFQSESFILSATATLRSANSKLRFLRIPLPLEQAGAPGSMVFNVSVARLILLDYPISLDL